MQKGSAPILVLVGILVILAAAAGAYFFGKSQIAKPQPPSPAVTSQTPQVTPKPPSIPDETANWKTYDAYIPATDEINKFSLKYPKEWHQEVPEMISEYTANWVSFTPVPIGQFANLGLVHVPIGVVSNEKKQSSKEYVDSVVIPGQKGSLCAGYIKIMPNIPDSLKNLDVTIVEGLCGQYNQGPFMVISKGNAILILESDFNGVISDSDRNLVYQIYATFKFSDIAATANWKTYTNSKYGFSFKYPVSYFQYQGETDSGIYLAPSQGNGGNGPKFLNAGDVWINAYIDTYKLYSSFYDYFDLISKESSPDHAFLQKVPAMIGWVNGFKDTYESPNQLGNARVFHYEGLVLKNGWALSITLSAWTQNDLDAHKDILDQILSTFKFTN